MRRILLVEDTPDLADALRENLEDEGHHVDVAGRGAEALARVEAHEPDLVILDLGLPDRDGFDVLRTLRERGRECAVLILTARGLEADTLQGFRLGADDYVTKPFRLGELLARVEALLRRTAPRAEAAPAPGARALSDDELRERFGLTGRQVAVARLLAEGWGNDELARRLVISPHTARNHTEHVFRKLGVTNRARVGARLRESA